VSAALPPGPRRPATLQTFAWIARPLPFREGRAVLVERVPRRAAVAA
jgi:hypothetical protein